MNKQMDVVMLVSARVALGVGKIGSWNAHFEYLFVAAAPLQSCVVARIDVAFALGVVVILFSVLTSAEERWSIVSIAVDSNVA